MVDIKTSMIFSGNANKALAKSVAKNLGITLGKASVKTFSDGDGQTDNSSSPRSRWILDPSNYSGGDALHGFLIDGESTATTQGQLQAVCYFKTGNILDPSKTIDTSTCSN